MFYGTLFSAQVICAIARGAIARLLGISGGQNDVDYLYPGYISTEVRRQSEGREFDAAIVEYVHFSKILALLPPSVVKILDTHDAFDKEFTRHAEATGLSRADIVLALQSTEAAYFRDILAKESGKGNGGDVRVLSHFLPIGERLSLASTRGATFLGSSFAANRASIRYFLDDVLPLVLQKLPAFKLFVAGAICGDIEDHPAVVKLGTVATIAGAFRSAPILINSIRAGGGIKIKLLEAMALGVPAISTRTGVQGLDERYTRGALVVDDGDARGFADAVVRVVESAQERERLGGLAHGAATEWAAAQKAELAALCNDIQALRMSHGRERQAG